MDDDHFSFSKIQDSFSIKSVKKSPLVLRMIVLVFAMVCGVYICSTWLKKIGTQTAAGFLSVKSVDRPCPEPAVEPWEIPYLHYLKPKTFSRAECACNPVRYFAILTMQRSGSGWFETLLNNHTNISSNGEIFSVKNRRSNVSTIFQTLDQIYNLDWLSSASKNECIAAVGLKWMLNQGLMQHHEQIGNYFKMHSISAIFLFRRNLLRRLISVLANSYDRDNKLLNGTHKSHVHSSREAEILASYKPSINTTLLIKDLKQVQNTTTIALESFKNTRHIVLYYEDIVKNRTVKPHALNHPLSLLSSQSLSSSGSLLRLSYCFYTQKLVDLLEFLKVPYQELKSCQVKIHKGSLSSQINNWDDVQKTLNGTEYHGFLHDYPK